MTRCIFLSRQTCIASSKVTSCKDRDSLASFAASRRMGTRVLRARHGAMEKAAVEAAVVAAAAGAAAAAAAGAGEAAAAESGAAAAAAGAGAGVEG